MTIIDSMIDLEQDRKQRQRDFKNGVRLNRLCSLLDLLIELRVLEGEDIKIDTNKVSPIYLFNHHSLAFYLVYRYYRNLSGVYRY
jgi:hypothetical protein